MRFVFVTDQNRLNTQMIASKLSFDWKPCQIWVLNSNLASFAALVYQGVNPAVSGFVFGLFARILFAPGSFTTGRAGTTLILSLLPHETQTWRLGKHIFFVVKVEVEKMCFFCVMAVCQKVNKRITKKKLSLWLRKRKRTDPFLGVRPRLRTKHKRYILISYFFIYFCPGCSSI